MPNALEPRHHELGLTPLLSEARAQHAIEVDDVQVGVEPEAGTRTWRRGGEEEEAAAEGGAAGFGADLRRCGRGVGDVEFGEALGRCCEGAGEVGCEGLAVEGVVGDVAGLVGAFEAADVEDAGVGGEGVVPDEVADFGGEVGELEFGFGVEDGGGGDDGCGIHGLEGKMVRIDDVLWWRW